MLKVEPWWFCRKRYLEDIPKVQDPFIIFPMSPLLLLNRQVNKEASPFVYQKVRLYCLDEGQYELSSWTSTRQRNFVSEVTFSFLTWGDMCAERERKEFYKVIRHVLGEMWHKVELKHEDLQQECAWGMTATWTLGVEDVKVT